MRCNVCTNWDKNQDKCSRYKNCEFEEDQKLIKNSQCYQCVWGRYTGVSFACSMPRCVKNIMNK